MSTKSKFTLIMVLTSLIGAIVFGLLSFLESRQSLRDALQGHAVFRHMTSEHLEALSNEARWKTYGADSPITEAGGYDAGQYLILRGRVEYVDPQGASCLSEGEGALIGMRYLVGRRANRLTSRALSDIEALFFPIDAIDMAMSQDKGLARALNQLADDKIRMFDRTTDAHVTTRSITTS